MPSSTDNDLRRSCVVCCSTVPVIMHSFFSKLFSYRYRFVGTKVSKLPTPWKNKVPHIWRIMHDPSVNYLLLVYMTRTWLTAPYTLFPGSLPTALDAEHADLRKNCAWASLTRGHVFLFSQTNGLCQVLSLVMWTDGDPSDVCKVCQTIEDVTISPLQYALLKVLFNQRMI